MPEQYEVVVGNVGSVYYGDDRCAANAALFRKQ